MPEQPSAPSKAATAKKPVKKAAPAKAAAAGGKAPKAGKKGAAKQPYFSLSNEEGVLGLAMLQAKLAQEEGEQAQKEGEGCRAASAELVVLGCWQGAASALGQPAGRGWQPHTAAAARCVALQLAHRGARRPRAPAAAGSELTGEQLQRQLDSRRGKRSKMPALPSMDSAALARRSSSSKGGDQLAELMAEGDYEDGEDDEAAAPGARPPAAAAARRCSLRRARTGAQHAASRGQGPAPQRTARPAGP